MYKEVRGIYLLESGYAYGIKIMSIEDGIETVHPETFKFRVE